MTKKEIGNSVFSCVPSNPSDGNLLFKFNGFVCEMEHSVALVSNNEYLIQLRKGVYLDCKSNALKGKCKACMVNTPSGLVHKVTRMPAISNLRLVVHGDEAWLANSAVCVSRNGEYFFGYGNGFRFED